MNIPQPFLSIIERSFKSSNLSTSQELKNFFNSCFRDVINTLKIKDYQTRASKTGKMFEYAFYYLIKNKYKFNLTPDVELHKACMTKGGSLDFGVFRTDEPTSEKNILCGIEAKGSDPESSVRPALKRTDTMKKAISQAYQFKRTYPEKLFFIVTNVLPTSGNSKCMMSLAEGDIVDKFIDVTNEKHLQQFIETIRKLS